MIAKYITLVGSLLYGFASNALETTFSFHLVMDGKEVGLPVKGKDATVELVRFYISGIELIKDDRIIWQETNSYHLLYFSESGKDGTYIKLPVNRSFNRIRFSLGIDSVTNVSGAMSGELDPVKGMYWTWQSGYINFKMEGTLPVDPDKKSTFQYHLGGYAAPNATIQSVELSTAKRDTIDIGFDIGRFLNGINYAETRNIMSPGSGAVKLSVKAAGCFEIMP